MVTFICNAVTPRLRAMSGIAVVTIVESNCSMKNAKATISGISRRSLRLRRAA